MGKKPSQVHASSKRAGATEETTSSDPSSSAFDVERALEEGGGTDTLCYRCHDPQDSPPWRCSHLRAPPPRGWRAAANA